MNSHRNWNFKMLETLLPADVQNLLHGYRNVSIVSPQEFIYEDREQTA